VNLSRHATEAQRSRRPRAAVRRGRAARADRVGWALPRHGQVCCRPPDATEPPGM